MLLHRRLRPPAPRLPLTTCAAPPDESTRSRVVQGERCCLKRHKNLPVRDSQASTPLSRRAKMAPPRRQPRPCPRALAPEEALGDRALRPERPQCARHFRGTCVGSAPELFGRLPAGWHRAGGCGAGSQKPPRGEASELLHETPLPRAWGACARCGKERRSWCLFSLLQGSPRRPGHTEKPGTRATTSRQ